MPLKKLTIGAKGGKIDTTMKLNKFGRIFMKGTKFLAGLLAGLSVVLGSWGLVACGGADSSSSSSGSSSSEATQPKGVVYEIVDDTAQVVGYEGTETSVVIEATYNGVSVTKIGAQAFKNSEITSVEIPDGVTEIGNSAFYGCVKLESVIIPDSVTSIGSSAFAYSNGLTSVVIGKNVESIGDFAFDYCSALSSITFNGTAKEWKKIEKNTGSWNTTFVPATKVACEDEDVDL